MYAYVYVHLVVYQFIYTFTCIHLLHIYTPTVYREELEDPGAYAEYKAILSKYNIPQYIAIIMKYASIYVSNKELLRFQSCVYDVHPAVTKVMHFEITESNGYSRSVRIMTFIYVCSYVFRVLYYAHLTYILHMTPYSLCILYNTVYTIVTSARTGGWCLPPTTSPQTWSPLWRWRIWARSTGMSTGTVTGRTFPPPPRVKDRVENRVEVEW